MNRLHELEIIAATLEEPARALVRSSVVALRQGRLDAAARTMATLAARRPALRWAAFLFAFEAAELRLAGSVEIATPVTRFVASNAFPNFEERWDPFGLTTFPDVHEVRLELAIAPATANHGFVLRVEPIGQAIASRHVAQALSHLVGELEAFLGVGVRISYGAVR